MREQAEIAESLEMQPMNAAVSITEAVRCKATQSITIKTRQIKANRDLAAIRRSPGKESFKTEMQGQEDKSEHTASEQTEQAAKWRSIGIQW